MRSPRFVLIGLVLAVAVACGGSAGGPDVGQTGAPATATAGTETETAGTDPAATDTPTATPPAAEDPCAQYEPGSQVTDERVLAVSSPAPGDGFASGDTVTGCTNAFEASFQWELLDADGDVIASGHEMATCGSGCLGTFEFTVDHEVSTARSGTLRVFTESAEDGSVQDEYEVPVQLQP